MIRNNISVILFLSFFLSLYSYPYTPAGDTLFRTESPVNFYITFKAGEEDAKNTNFILQEISLYRQQRLEEVQLGYRLHRKVALTQTEDRRFKLTFNISGVSLPEVRYKGVALHNELMPSGLESRVSLYDSSGILVKKINFRTLSLKDNDMTGSLYFIIHEPAILDSLSVESQSWFFTETDYERFSARLEQINSYYAASRLCDQLSDRLTEFEYQIEYDPVKMFFINFETARALDRMEQNMLFHDLAVEEDDPAGFMVSLDALKRALTRSNTLLKTALGSQSIRLDEMLAGDAHEWTKVLEEYYRWAGDEPYEFLHFYEGMTYLQPKTLEVFNKMVSEVFGKGISVQQQEDFIRAVFRDFHDRAQSYTDVQNFARAHIFVENARMVCGWLEGLECWNLADAQDSYIDKTLSDMYLGMLQKALQRNNVGLALDYLTRLEDVNGAGAYRDFLSEKGGQIYYEYLKNYISDSLAYYDHRLPDLMPEIEHKIIMNAFGDYRDSVILLYHRLKQTVLMKYYERIHRLCDQGRPMEADLLLSRMERDKGMILTAADTLFDAAERAIATSRREYFIRKGEVYLMYSQPMQALRAFYLAKSIPAAGKVVTYDSLQQLMRIAALPIMDSSYIALQACVEYGDYQCVNRVMKKAEKCIDDYDFRNDPQIMSKLNEWHLFVERNKCSFISKDINRKKQELDRLMEQRDFFRAEELALKIQTLADQYGYCGISVKQVKKLFNLLCPATQYLVMRDSLEAIDDPREYITRHQEIDRFYVESGIEQLGIKHQPISRKVLENKDPHWLMELFSYFMDENNPDAAFLVMKAMKSAGMKPVNLMDEQIALGKLLARHHISEDDSRNPYLLINDYTLNDKWYSFLRKYYLATWEEHRGK